MASLYNAFEKDMACHYSILSTEEIETTKRWRRLFLSLSDALTVHNYLVFSQTLSSI